MTGDFSLRSPFWWEFKSDDEMTSHKFSGCREWMRSEKKTIEILYVSFGCHLRKWWHIFMYDGSDLYMPPYRRLILFCTTSARNVRNGMYEYSCAWLKSSRSSIQTRARPNMFIFVQHVAMCMSERFIGSESMPLTINGYRSFLLSTPYGVCWIKICPMKRKWYWVVNMDTYEGAFLD